MLGLLGLVVACLSLSVSAATAWLTLWRRGTIRMAQPPTIYFGPDGVRGEHSKIFVRGFLYATSLKSHIVEGMFARVRRGDQAQTFSVWVCGGAAKDLSRGAGLAVSSEGIALHHHFLLPRDGSTFRFLPGDYTVDLFAVVVGQRKPLLLRSVELTVNDADASRLANDNSVGLYFDWSPETLRWNGHVDNARPPEPPPSPVFVLTQDGDEHARDKSSPHQLDSPSEGKSK